MSKVISYVADMTRQRDRDILEVSLANVLFKLLEPTEVRLWRVVDHPSGLRARSMASIRTGEPVAVSDPAARTSEWPLVEGLPGVRECWSSGAALSVTPTAGAGRRHFLPVVSEKGPIGVLELEKSRELMESDLQLIDGLLSIYRNHLALLDYSEHDELTGLLNRKTFEDVFAARIQQHTDGPGSVNGAQVVGRRASRADASLWLAVVDIDHFKRINDTFGHVFGDEVLLLMARLMRSTFRIDDSLFRFGGEEFVVLLASTDREGAAVALERFRSTVEAYRFPQVGQVTVSVGYGKASGPQGSVTTFERADSALYVAKQEGRNRCRCYETLVDAGVLQPKSKAASDVELF